MADEDEPANVSREILAAEDSMNSDDHPTTTDTGVTQAEVYDNLKRIGELEDEKKKIQEEIQDRTEQLRGVIEHIDSGSILYKMLESALRDTSQRHVTTGSGKKAAKAAPNLPPKASARKSRRK
jgi:uncharacterized protein (UPF0335 family)